MQRLLSASRARAVLPRLLMAHRAAAAATAARPPPPPRRTAAPTAAAANTETTAADDDVDAPTCVRARLAPIAGPIAEVLSDALLGFGAQSVSVGELRREGEPESPIFDAGGSTGGGSSSSQYWPRCEVIAHFALETDADAAIRSACEIASGVAGVLLGEAPAGAPEPAPDAGFLLPPPYLLAAVANREWVEQIKASYVPLDVVPGVVRIVPEGHEEEEEGDEGEGESEGGGGSSGSSASPCLKISLSPGVAFGTGEHNTTRLCLRAIARFGGLPVDGEENGDGGGGGGGRGAAPATTKTTKKNLLAGARVLDYGTGSGVLAMAALLLGAERAVGTDTDPLAVRASQANARLNSVEAGRFVALRVPPSLPETDDQEDEVDAQLKQEAGGGANGTYDFVVANILRGPLLELAPRMARLCSPGGRLLLSGILAEQAPEVERRYASLGFRGFVLETEGSWAALSAVKEE